MINNKYLTSIIFFLIYFICANSCIAQWNINSSSNTPVCSTSGNQIDLRMIDDGHRGAFIAWKDYRPANYPDIYIQHIDSLGYATWVNNGVVLCNNLSDQSTPSLVTDMHGGAIVAWSDWRSNLERDIYAQRIDSLGNVLWTTNGMVVTDQIEREHNEKIISDNEGGAIIVFEKQYNGSWKWDIWAQRINSQGSIVWPAGGVQLCFGSEDRLNPKIQKDGKGGAFITWEDHRNLMDYDIYAQHIDSSGVLLWGSYAKPVCEMTGAQINPKIDPDSISGGVVISWVDKRLGVDYDIYAQRIDVNGTRLWGTSGLPVCTAVGNQSAVDMISNTRVAGTIFAWKDERNGNFDIYAQRMNISGANAWGQNGIPICTSPYPQVNPNITGDGKGGAIIVWQDSSAGNWNIKSQKINQAGIIQWAINGVVVSDAPDSQTSPKNISDGAGGSIYAWEDMRSVIDADIYVQRICFNGTTNGLRENFNSINGACFPNPFTDKLTVTLNVPNEENILIKIFNVIGDEVASVNSVFNAQKNSYSFSFENKLPEGMYFVKIKGETFNDVIKVLKVN